MYSLEIIPELGRRARRRLAKLGYENITVKIGDGYYGWPEQAPFAGIVVTAAASHIPPPLVNQLEKGGRMIIPVGPTGRTQSLTLVTKEDGEVSKRQLAPVRFVPFLRKNN